ncbi:hypothetical protein HX030_10460 [Myroides odoratimimus]|uniref:hypothetical protein n=1 Tax=Myroides TaxID=76831 RepID=UPI002576ED7B|nr:MULTISPECIES: hypothetical protein [Myroides]MDM1328790.1 hypothetical protein [Myroides odoratimimus]MDM1395849.1 hypothetical protein [Myroides odoratimimus]MDM1402048.1 hypothetical protein [Myroides odoratimimus]MDM1467461.1 hypothetical protein [Myroides odoratimimus]MDM1470479.1 hypothetical protein [Myroides odoratimimus]
MKKQIKDYLNLIYSEIKECYADEINLRETDFEKYSIFDFANFHLIYQYILNDNAEKKDFFISIPEEEYRENFFTSIFHSIVLIKLFQSFFNYEKNRLPILNNGDLIYKKHNKEHRIFIVKSTYNEKVKINFQFPKKNELGIVDFFFDKPNFTKLNPNLVDNKNASKNIDRYRSFLSATFNEKFPFITDFKNRTLVIAEKSFFRESNFLPIRYTNKNGKISNDLPFFSYLVECCNDFNSAQNFLLNGNHQFDEIIIIGDAKYRNSFDFILQEKYREKYKNIIVIGTDKPNSENQFLEWWWSNDEVKIANNEIPNEITKVTLNNSNLYSSFIEIFKECEILKDESKVNFTFILKYTNFFLRMILVNTNLSKGIYQEYLDRLNHFFQSEAFLDELNNFFYEKNIYNPDTIKGYTDRIFNLFSKLSCILENENLKWNYIKQKAKESNPKPVYLVVEKKNYDAVYTQIKNEKINNIHLISDKRIDNLKLYLDKWINDKQQNSERQIIIIPYLNNINLYSKIKSIKGYCEILNYKNLDEISFDNVERAYQNLEKIRLNHKDRLIFFKTDFVHSTEINKRELDDIFSFDLNNEEFRNNPYETIDLPKGHSIYEIEFSDGTKDKFDSSKGVFLVENNEQIKTTIGEVYENATIRFYQNNSKDEFLKILKIFDTENLLDSFDKYADSWKQTLKDLSKQFSNLEEFYNSLFTSFKINFNTFRLYLDEKSSTRFPRVKTLEAIRELCINMNNNCSYDLIVTEFEKFKIYSKKDHSIRQQAGKILGNDLLDYIASNKEEKSDSLKKLPNEILEKLTATIQEKTIIKKTLVDE